MSIQCLVSTSSPANFSPAVQVAACYIQCGDKILFLQRPATPKYNSCWGVPAGKLEPQEQPRAAGIREVFEETQITIHDKDLQDVGKLYMRLPHLDYVYFMFCAQFDQCPTVTLNDEHEDFVWVMFTEALKLPLMPGAEEALQFYKRFIDETRTP